MARGNVRQRIFPPLEMNFARKEQGTDLNTKLFHLLDHESL